MLKTNFLYPNSIALAAPNPKVTSGVCFFPSFTTTRRSPSRSKANPIPPLRVFSQRSTKLSAVGSGPLLELEGSSFMVCTLHPNFSSKLGAKLAAAPPPMSTNTFGGESILPIRLAAS